MRRSVEVDVEYVVTPGLTKLAGDVNWRKFHRLRIPFRDPDIIVPPEELIIATAGYGRWQILITLTLCLTIVIHVMNSSLEPAHHMTGWWCEKPETLRGWTDPQWIIYSHVNAVCWLELFRLSPRGSKLT